VSPEGSDPLVLIAAIGLAIVAAVSAYAGWWYGHEQGMCEVGCAEGTAGAGTGIYRGGNCRCVINGQEVAPL